MHEITPRETKKLSKFLALVLRHKPQTIGIKLDPEGWCSVEQLVDKINKKGWQYTVTREHIEILVANDEKQRYSLEDSRIRAAQGHSNKNVSISYSPIEPPQYLYHGTSPKSIDDIMASGLLPMKRHYVHLSKDVETATKVGLRYHAKPVILQIKSSEAYQQQVIFYMADNGVYLAKHVPAEYIEIS